MYGFFYVASLELWLKEVLKVVTNKLGKFIALDKDFVFVEDKRMSRVLVELDLIEVLEVDIEINWQYGNFIQPLDYWKFIFCYFFFMILATS